MRKYIPNTLTSLNLFSGCIATVFAIMASVDVNILSLIGYTQQECFLYSSLFIALGAIFDFFDGFSARMLNAHSIIGKDLDSLADDITFGLAPASIMFAIFRQYPFTSELARMTVPFLAFLIAVFSAIRLAKFNNDTRQSKSFIGLPTPANALMIAGMANAPTASFLWMDWPEFSMLWQCPGVGIAVLLILTGTICYLLVSEIPMFSLKEKGKLQIIFIVLSAVLILLCGFFGLALSMAIYITISWILMIMATGKSVK